MKNAFIDRRQSSSQRLDKRKRHDSPKHIVVCILTVALVFSVLVFSHYHIRKKHGLKDGEALISAFETDETSGINTAAEIVFTP